ncbi:MAG: hypothetical protein ACLUOF_03260 [Ruminococcus sp.]
MPTAGRWRNCSSRLHRRQRFGHRLRDTESGALTCIAYAPVENGTLTGCVDIRFPVCTTKETVLEQVQAALPRDSSAGADSGDPHHTRKIPRLYRTCWRSTRSRPVHRAMHAIGGGTLCA